MNAGCALRAGTEVGLDAEMDLQISPLEPAAASRREVCGLRNVRDAQHVAVERDRFELAPGGHRELHVIETNHRHGHQCGRRSGGSDACSARSRCRQLRFGRDANAGREPAAAELTKLDEVPTF